ncbi:MAG: hypothetical protein LBO21_10190 [Synergistaceae bacterium]|nr:hypothetical protein [Synergistaceae bacterium]
MALDKTSSGRVEILVNTVTSRSNVIRFAENKGWEASAEEREGGCNVILLKG